MSSRTATIATRDHGPVTIPEPSWCLGNHPAGEYRVDITHCGPDHTIEADTGRGYAVTVIRAALESRPFTTEPFGGRAFVNVDLDGDHHPHDAEGLRQLRAALAEQLAVLDHLAQLLDGLPEDDR